MDSAELNLVCHTYAPPSAVDSVIVSIGPTQHGLEIVYTILGPIERIAYPALQQPERADDLWQTTCLELFLRGEEASYSEYNFSPSTRWAAYRFSGYREGREPLATHVPALNVWTSMHGLVLSAHLDMPAYPTAPIGISAVVEETDGTKSYWALRHPPSGPPDFHHPDCFALTLPAPGGA